MRRSTFFFTLQSEFYVDRGSIPEVDICNKMLRITSDTSRPMSWQRGQEKLTQTEWSWTNLFSVVYLG